jgi:hypothetical protein
MSYPIKLPSRTAKCDMRCRKLEAFHPHTDEVVSQKNNAVTSKM